MTTSNLNRSSANHPTPEEIRQMSPTEYVRLVGREHPESFDLDALVSSDDMAEIEEVRNLLRDHLHSLIPLAQRVRDVMALMERAPAGGTDPDADFDAMSALLDL